MNDETQALFDELCRPFPPESIHFRIGATNKDKTKGMVLYYVDARDVQDRLDQVMGMDAWERRHERANNSVMCQLSLRMPNERWVTKEDGASDTDVEAEKGGLSDSFKRAAVNFGVGRYLYSMASPWVDLEAGRIPEATIKKLRESYEIEISKIGWGGPAECAVLKFALRVVQLFVKTKADVPVFLEANTGMIQQLRVKHREVIMRALDSVGNMEQAA